MDRAGFEPATFRCLDFCEFANRTFFGLTLPVYQAELPAHVCAGSIVVGLNLVGGAAAGTFTPFQGGLNPASRLQWPRRVTSPFRPVRYQATLRRPRWNRRPSREYVSFQPTHLPVNKPCNRPILALFLTVLFDTNPSIFVEESMSDFNKHARRTVLKRPPHHHDVLTQPSKFSKTAMKSSRG